MSDARLAALRTHHAEVLAAALLVEQAASPAGDAEAWELAERFWRGGQASAFAPGAEALRASPACKL